MGGGGCHILASSSYVEALTLIGITELMHPKSISAKRDDKKNITAAHMKSAVAFANFKGFKVPAVVHTTHSEKLIFELLEGGDVAVVADVFSGTGHPDDPGVHRLEGPAKEEALKGLGITLMKRVKKS